MNKEYILQEISSLRNEIEKNIAKDYALEKLNNIKKEIENAKDTNK